MNALAPVADAEPAFSLFHTVEQALATGQSHKAMRLLIDELRSARLALGQEWHTYAKAARNHPAIQMAYLCPFTRHAVEKPYGYPGDAELIDYIYGYGTPPESTEATNIFRFTTSSPACRAVRFRRARAAELIDETVHAVGPSARIVSVACGRFRELELAAGSKMLQEGNLIGIDQDQLSLDVAQATYDHTGLTTYRKNITDLIVGRWHVPKADLIYSTGLYDYLSDEVAGRLTANLLGALRPGGKLVIVNFTHDAEDIGYMEAVMDWWLIYREEGAMMRMVKGVPPELISRVRQYRDPSENLTFLEIHAR